MQSENYKIEELKHLLLNDDRESINALKLEIERLKAIIEDKELLDTKIGPIINTYLDQYTKDIPSKLGPSITESLKNEIANSQDTIVDVLYPIMGKLIKKYIQKEFEKLSDQINKTVQNRFSIKALKRKLKSMFTGVNENDFIINDLSDTQIQELFIVEKHSGILKGNFSKTNTIDKDVLSAMLTAIKSFVEDALKTGNDQLETIEYGLYNIYIQNFKSYYIAVIIHGVFDVTYREQLREKLNTFSQKKYKSNLSKEALSLALEKEFTV